ncbi:PREDICTED: trypsin-1-like [Dufourea novaeangliae]|uniref:trypsin-1-like n=1 Tax=Dufourea novaeangliae TaxID=178035 RepID=UPI000767B39D|nr:PREDICTED: trypsin-1-like [Dufourea novaeangliae]
MLAVLFLLTFAVANCFSPRIVGGSNTTIDKYPYQVSIHVRDKLVCGGSLISPDWVLTAAHCIYRETASSLQIRVKSTFNSQGGTVINGIRNAIAHPMYNTGTLEYDVALIKLPTSIKFDVNAKPIALASRGMVVQTSHPEIELRVGSDAVVTGWGKTSVGGSMSNTLQVLPAPVVDQDSCKKIYAAKYQPITKMMLCAGNMAGGKDVCQGDSGGPLVLNGVQIGIVSFGFKCAEPGFPGVYTRVSEMRDWIDKMQRTVK